MFWRLEDNLFNIFNGTSFTIANIPVHWNTNGFMALFSINKFCSFTGVIFH